MKRKLLALLVVIALVCCMSVTVFAHDVPDMDRLGSVQVTMQYNGTVVPGGSLTIIRVGDVHEDNGDYSWKLSAAFAACGLSLDNLGAVDLAKNLADYAKANNISGTKATIDANGKAVFADLKLGLYLLVQEDAAPSYNAASPFLVSVPQVEDGVYIYEVNASPKVELTPAPTTQPTEPTVPELPQTGQLNWPIPIMVVVGLCLFVLGWFLYLRKAGETDAK